MGKSCQKQRYCIYLNVNIQRLIRKAIEWFVKAFLTCITVQKSVNCGRRGNLCGHVWTSSAFYPGLQYQSLTWIRYPHISSHNCQYKIDPTFLKCMFLIGSKGVLKNYKVFLRTSRPIMGNDDMVAPIIHRFKL
jgi:hypothetical protein